VYPMTVWLSNGRYPSMIFFFSSCFIWFGDGFVAWDSLNNVVDNADRYSDWLTWVAVLLIPSFIVLLLCAVLLESVVLVAVCFGLFFVITRLLRFSLSASQLVKVCVLALIPFMVLQIGPLLYVRWFLVPAALYILLVGAAVWILGERRFRTHS